MDEKDAASWKGFFYAGLLCLCTLVSSLLSTQFSFQANKVQVGLRAAVVSAIYTKATSTRIGASGRLHSAKCGEVVDMMSTDCDRIANFCPGPRPKREKKEELKERKSGRLLPFSFLLPSTSPFLFLSSQLSPVLESAGADCSCALSAVPTSRHFLLGRSGRLPWC
jgi:hypothetical protein